MALYFFSGSETFLKKKELNKIISEIECPEMNVMECYEYSPEILEFVSMPPIIEDRKVCILRFFPDKQEFIDAVEVLPDGLDVYIVAKEMPDQRKSVIKQLLKIAKQKEFGKINESILYKCIVSRLKGYGYSDAQIEAARDDITKAFHVYMIDSEMDLDVVQKHVDLIAFSGGLTKENICAFAPDSANLKAYKLAAMLLDQDRGCLDFARDLIEQGDQAIAIISLVLYQIRICYKSVLFQDEKYLSMIGIREYQLYRNFLTYDGLMYRDVYDILISGIKRIKKGEKQSSVLLDCLAGVLNRLQES